MKTYEIIFSGLKTVDDWDPENGAQGKERIIDQWSNTYKSTTKPSRASIRSHFTDFIYEKTGLRVQDFYYWTDEPGRFTTNRLENNNGFADDDGHYLADYDIRIEWRIVEPSQPLQDNLGLQSVDG